MPRIPQLQNTQVSLNRLARPNTSYAPDTRGESLGQALGNIGEVVQGVQQFNKQQAEKARLLKEKEQAEADRTAFMEADRQVGEQENDLLFNPEAGAFTKAGKDAIGLTPNTLAEYDKRVAQVEAGLTSPKAKQAFRESIGRRRLNVEGDLQRYEGKQREGYYAQERQAYAEQAMSNAVKFYNQPERIEDEIAKVGSVINQTPGLSAEQRTAKLGELRSKAYAGVVDRYLANDQLKGAEKYYASIKDRVGGEDAAKVERAIRVTRDRLEAKREAVDQLGRSKLQEQMADIRASALSRVPVISVPPEKEYVRLYGEKGRAMYQESQRMANLSLDTAAYDAMPTGQLIEKAQEYQPTQQAGAAAQREIAGIGTSIIGNVLRERAEDGAGYLQKNSTVLQSAYQAFLQQPTPQNRDAYITTLKSERVRLGIPGNQVLSKSDAAALAAQFSDPKSAEKLAGVVRRQLDSWGDKWPLVQAQIAKDIPDLANIIASPIPQAAAETLAGLNGLKESELKGMLPSGMTWDSLQERVDSKFEDLKRSLPLDGTRTWNGYRDAATRLALWNMQKGDGQKGAMDRAYEDLIGSRFNVGEVRGITMMVPKKFRADDIQTEAGRMLDDFKVAPGIASPNAMQSMPENVRLKIRQDGYWMQNGDTSGLRLYLGTTPTQYRISYEELQAKADSRRSQAENAQERDYDVRAAARGMGGK